VDIGTDRLISIQFGKHEGGGSGRQAHRRLGESKLNAVRKRLITPIPHDTPRLGEKWLDLDGAGLVEVTSEEKEFPIESALVVGKTTGWRAADSGTQTIRLIFDEPQRLNHISLVLMG
jgi:hypothetical protein